MSSFIIGKSKELEKNNSMKAGTTQTHICTIIIYMKKLLSSDWLR